jgi:hypothetical protein
VVEQVVRLDPELQPPLGSAEREILEEGQVPVVDAGSVGETRTA